MMHTDAASQQAIDYHQRTKHHFHRQARSLGFMDWATQPDPFKRFDGAELLVLPRPESERPIAYEAIYQLGTVEPRPVDANSISELFYFSLALSAWKSFRGSTWALRIKPSSGNLHPTEGYLLADAGVDTLIFDTTNDVTYQEAYRSLCDVFRQIRAEGERTPQTCFLASMGSARKLWDKLYSKAHYSDLWFHCKGKPVLDRRSATGPVQLSCAHYEHTTYQDRPVCADLSRLD